MKMLILSVFTENEELLMAHLGIERLQYHVEKNNNQCDICKIGAQDHKPYLEKAANGEYAIIGLSSTYCALDKDLSAIACFFEASRKNNTLFVAGGQSPSVYPELWLKVGFDVVVHGYGEYPLVTMLDTLDKAKCVGVEAVADVPGISLMHNGRLRTNPAAPLTPEQFRQLNVVNPIEMGVDISVLPEVHRITMPDEKIYTNFTDLINVFTSDQCPNSCGYCSSSSFIKHCYGKKRPYAISAHDIVDVLHHIFMKTDKTGVNILDDDFCGSVKRVKEFCTHIAEEKNNGTIPKDIRFRCQTRAAAFIHPATKEIDVELISLMRNAGFEIVSLGIENFSERLLHSPFMNKKGYDIPTIHRLIDIMLGLGLTPSVNFMIAVPDSTPEEVVLNFNTYLDLLEKKVAFNVNIGIFAFPGAPMFSSPDYPTTQTEHISPLNNARYVKKEYFIPHHPQVAAAFSHYMKRGVADEIVNTQHLFGSDAPFREWYTFYIVKFLAFARCLNHAQIIERLESTLASRIAQLKQLQYKNAVSMQNRHM